MAAAGARGGAGGAARLLPRGASRKRSRLERGGPGFSQAPQHCLGRLVGHLRGARRGSGTRSAAHRRMVKKSDKVGISNRSPQEEDARQAKVEARKDELPDFENV